MAAAPQVNGHSSSPSTDIPTAQTSKIQPSDVGWQFVPQYYNFVNKQPHRLHCFYNKRSTFIHGEEGEDAQVALGQQEIHDRITSIGYDECKVYIHSIDSQSSANGGILILVIGEMSNKNQPWRKFTQTFFLAEQPNGYFVLNDIFRYLKEEVDDEDVDEEDSVHQEAAVEVPADAPSVPDVDPVPIPPAEAPTPVPEAAEPTPAPEPEPVQAPAHPDPKAVPEEAVIASVPDKDVAPSEPAAAVEEPVTATNPPVDESAKPAASPAPAAPKAAAPSSNGPSSTPAAQAAPAAAAPAPPAQPAAPPKPKTWASMAASGSTSGAVKSWGSVVSGSAASTSTSPAPAAAPAPKKEEAAASPAAAPTAPAPSLEGKHQFYVNATRVNTPHCFVKLPNWSPDGAPQTGESLDENQVRQIASRFGDVAKVEIVKTKACAFVEFQKVEAARKAIIASLPVAQGGEGGVKTESGNGRLNFETRKEKEDRRKGQGQAPGQGQQAQGGQQRGQAGEQRQQRGPREGQANGERGQQGGRGGRGGRGRGGAPGGDRAAQK